MSTPKIRPLNVELQVIAKEELFEDPEKIQENLEVLREWISKTPHINARTDDQFLVTFLRGCKYSMEKVKQKFDLYYTIRTHLPEMMAKRDPLEAKMHAIIKLGVGLPLPITENPGSPSLLMFRVGAYDPSLVQIQDVMRVTMMILDILMQEDDNLGVAGQVFVCDLAGTSFSHFVQMHPAFLKKSIMLIQDANPIRLKGIHYINAPKSFEQLFNLVKSLMNEKLRSRLYVHSSFDSLYKVVSRSLMPTEYEGEAGSLQSLTETWEKKLFSYRDYFIEEDNYGVDEKKRVGKPKNPDSLFGIDGTFKQLQFD